MSVAGSALLIVTAVAFSALPQVRAQLQAKGCCVAFALDQSTSLTDDQFAEITLFVSIIIDAFTLYGQPNGQRAAVIKFSTAVTPEFRLNTYNTAAAASDHVRNLLLDGGLTFTHLAIAELGNLLVDCTPGYNRAGVIITDGNSEDPLLTAREGDLFKASGTILIVVGVGVGINHAELRNLATHPSLYFQATFADLRNVSIEISNVVCSELKPTTTTTTPTTTTTTPTTTTTTPTTTTTTPTTTTTTPTTTTTTPTTTSTTPTTTTTTPTTTMTTPTTTTTTPTTTVTVAPIPTTGECLKCLFINGLYIFPDDDYCYVFHSCINYYQAFAQLRPCPFGQFFDKGPATCREARFLDCPTDPCKDPTVSDYPNHLMCSSYFECVGGRTYREVCCDPDQRYVQGSGCVADATCTDPCPPKPRDPECVLRPKPGNPDQYEENVGGGMWVPRHCASGTSFDEDECHCSETGPRDPDPDCQNRLHLSFNRNVQDARRRKYVTNNRPKVKTVRVAGSTGRKAARFNGGSRLLVKGYANAWWGKELVIRTRFLESPRSALPAGTTEVLFGNGDCGTGATVTVKYDRANNRVNAKVVTGQAGSEQTYRASVAPVNSGSWKNVELRYDGNTLRLTVDNEFDDTVATGNIATRQTSLQIGSGCPDNAEYFTGYEDEFYVFPCIP